MKSTKSSPELERALKLLMSLPEPPKCAGCDEVIEQWWSYCAMCGKHLAAGNDRS